MNELPFPNAEKGFICPCCSSFCKVWKKPLTGTAVADLIRLTQLYKQKGEAIHISEFTKQRSNFYTLRMWGLIDKGDVEVDNKKRSSGFWKPLKLGIDFIAGVEALYNTAETYNNKLIRLSGRKVFVREALGIKFNYEKLMKGE